MTERPVLKTIKDLLMRNFWLKSVSLLLALVLWSYIVNELNKGSEEDKEFMSRLLPAGAMAAKKLMIKPVLVGTQPPGYTADPRKAVVIPEYCIVVGSKDLLSKIRYAYTVPIDMRGVSKSFTRSVALNPIAPGIFMEETLVQVTVSVEKQ